MRRTFSVPSRFHPAYSLLGRWMQRLLGDTRRAEALFLVALSMILLGLILAQYVAWMFLKPAIVAEPIGTVAVTFWGCQIGGVMLCMLTCVLGFRPALIVTTTAQGLHLHQGTHTLTLTYNDITSVEPISPLLFHRHYGRYAATQVFIAQMTPDLLLLHTTGGPVVLGLLPGDHDILLHHLEIPFTPSYSVPIARVA